MEVTNDFNTKTDIDENKDNSDNDSDDEIESISSTCTWALNYKLPARYVYGKRDKTTETDETTETVETTTQSQQSSTKRSHSDSKEYDSNDDEDEDEDYDDDDDSDHEKKTMTKKKKKWMMWTPEEDAIIIREYDNNPNSYSDGAMKYLSGRSRKAIRFRWSEYLSKHCSSDTTTVMTNKIWTPEEDAILIREYEKKPGRYVDEANKDLPDRSRDAILGRWNTYLSQHYSSDTVTVKTRKKWTPEEDAIIIRECEKNPRGYTDEAMKHLPDRSRDAIIIRWSVYLNKK